MSRIIVKTTGNVVGYSTLLESTPLSFRSIGTLMREFIKTKSEAVKIAVKKVGNGYKVSLVSAGDIGANAAWVIESVKPAGNTVRYNYSHLGVNLKENGEDLELAIDAMIDYVLENVVSGSSFAAGQILVIDQASLRLAKYGGDIDFGTDNFQSDEIAMMEFDGASLGWE